MTTPPEPESDRPQEGVNLGKDVGNDPRHEAGNQAAGADEPFDPYRFGKPDHPIPAEYAPPGYTGPTTPPPDPYGTSPYGTSPYGTSPYGTSPYGTGPYGANPYGTPADNPYQYPPPDQQQQQQYPQHYQPYGYNAPQPPPYSTYQQPRTGHGKAIAALVFGILSIVFCWLSFFDAIFVILGLIFALIAIGEAKAPGRGGRSMAVAGLICTIVGAVLATVFTVWLVHVANQCGGFNNSNVPGWDQCVRDHI